MQLECGWKNHYLLSHYLPESNVDIRSTVRIYGLKASDSKNTPLLVERNNNNA